MGIVSDLVVEPFELGTHDKILVVPDPDNRRLHMEFVRYPERGITFTHQPEGLLRALYGVIDAREKDVKDFQGEHYGGQATYDPSDERPYSLVIMLSGSPVVAGGSLYLTEEQILKLRHRFELLPSKLNPFPTD